MLHALLLAAAVLAPRAAADDHNPKTDPPYPVELQLLAETNAQRASHGLRPLAIDHALLVSARNHCIAQATAGGSCWHGRPTTAAPWQSENVAWNQANAQEAVRAWMNSPGHRRAMLGNFRSIGISGYTYRGQFWWTAQFRR